ncbi:MAG TPA: hypothetical protein VNJ02_00670 [Vicinamibacterales bacterium]|nr:hypothetical protein [Vicinamibacterales bacterium]
MGLIRKRLRTEIDLARKAAAARRERATTVTRAYETFLGEIAIPAFRQFATVMRAEGIPFEVQTPLHGVRLVSDRNRDDALEVELDPTVDPPQVMFVGTQTRGSRILRTERPIKDGATPDQISEDDLIERLIEELRPWLS